VRQFIAETAVDSHGMITVTGDRFHYLCTVLRSVPGDMIQVRLPQGMLVQMTVASVDKKKKQAVLQAAGSLSAESSSLAAVPVQEKPELELWLFQFVAKPAKMELIVRQAVECGVAVVVPVAGTFCQSGAVKSAQEAAKLNGAGGRWERIITEAREQSGSAVATRVNECVSVAEAVALWNSHVAASAQNASLAVVLYEQTAGTMQLHRVIKQMPMVKSAAVAVGAEGGISPEEIELMQKGGFISVHFATNILRCETAAIYGIAALQTALMEKNIWQSKE